MLFFRKILLIIPLIITFISQLTDLYIRPVLNMQKLVPMFLPGSAELQTSIQTFFLIDKCKSSIHSHFILLVHQLVPKKFGSLSHYHDLLGHFNGTNNGTIIHFISNTCFSCYSKSKCLLWEWPIERSVACESNQWAESYIHLLCVLFKTCWTDIDRTAAHFELDLTL